MREIQQVGLLLQGGFALPLSTQTRDANAFCILEGDDPASKIYALKIFDSRGGGSPTSRVIAAIERERSRHPGGLRARGKTGLVRVALQGDWTNAGKISADLEIVQQRSELGKETAEGIVAQGDMVPVALSVPGGTQVLAFSLFWENDWSRYPTNDLDLILMDPNGKLNLDAATLNSPERAAIAKPTPGT